MNVLVTGGAGFIGSHLVERLVAERAAGVTVRVVDNLSTGKRENLQPFLDRVDFIQGDLQEEEIREKAVRDVEVVFHLAALPSVPRSVAQPIPSHLNGVHATLLLLDSARRHKVRRFIYAGSSSAYGDTETLPRREDLSPRPLSPYAVSKLAGEYYLRAFGHCYGMDTLTLRYFNIFGPRQDPNSPYSGVIAKFCTAYLKDEPIKVFGDGEQSRDFTFVRNAVEANWLASRAPGPFRGEVFNIGCGSRTSLNQMLHYLDELTGRPRKPIYEPARTGDVLHSQADITRARERLGYDPRVDFRTGLGLTFEWYRRMAGA
jgi:nucleoside-diphosphate-sugar epimerase